MEYNCVKFAYQLGCVSLRKSKKKRILCFFIKQINPRSLGSWCVKETEQFISRVDSSVPFMHHDPRDLGLICLVKKRNFGFSRI